ncbi:MAG TPA: hypothetical protein VHT03_10380 [Rhizomicrobium sp.]|jgi:hypothetical protein|nr:hypothetical protein [Rhizomicrobium sp.]
MAQAKVTTDHDTIKSWAEKRGGHPATVKKTEQKHEPGLLRIEFDSDEQALEDISWDEFFEKFDEKDLAFLYQDKTASGKTSRFHKFISRATAEDEDFEDQEEDEE